MKVSIIQMNMRVLERDWNFDHAEELIRRAVHENAPDVVVLPEMWNTAFSAGSDLSQVCDHDLKQVRARFSPLARELNANIVAGSVSNERDGKLYNSACVIDRHGACVAEYDKTHLFSPMGESDDFAPGNHLATFTLDGVRCGIIICYEVRFPSCGARWRCAGQRSSSIPPSGRRSASITGKRSPPPAPSKTSSLSSRATPAASAAARSSAALRACSTRGASCWLWAVRARRS